ncbi:MULTISPECIES: SGM_5486 family transporter-associated protein [Streptomycetaceae]|nr:MULTISPECIES: SGM_5486 family transporter-associated protein [Streptomycetaceae]MDX2850220.1 SGM_5486 family transporter-associated protein [Streptomyces sp. PA03-3a]
MPVLEPDPPQPQKKLLIVFGLMMAVPAFVAVIAVIGAKFG